MRSSARSPLGSIASEAPNLKPYEGVAATPKMNSITPATTVTIIAISTMVVEVVISYGPEGG